MAAFIVFLREETSNDEEMETYGKLALATLAGRSASPRAFYGKLDVLEGPVFEGAVILEFSSMAEARSWYDSAEYQAAAVHRKSGAIFRVFVVEGIKA